MKKVMSLFILVVLAIVLSGFSQGAFTQEFDEFGVAYELAVEKLNQKSSRMNSLMVLKTKKDSFSLEDRKKGT